MSPRQRWMILYPLLMLAVCLAVKHEWQWMTFKAEKEDPNRVIQARLVRARQLEIVDDQGRRMVEIAQATDGHGLINVYSNKNSERPLVVLHTDSDGKIGMIETCDVEGKRLVQLAGNDQGGMILLPGIPNHPLVLLGHNPQLRLSGLFLFNPDGSVLLQERGGKVIPFLPQILEWPKEPSPQKPEERGDQPVPEKPADVNTGPKEAPPAESPPPGEQEPKTP